MNTSSSLQQSNSAIANTLATVQMKKRCLRSHHPLRDAQRIPMGQKPNTHRCCTAVCRPSTQQGTLPGAPDCRAEGRSTCEQEPLLQTYTGSMANAYRRRCCGLLVRRQRQSVAQYNAWGIVDNSTYIRCQQQHLHKVPFVNGGNGYYTMFPGMRAGQAVMRLSVHSGSSGSVVVHVFPRRRCGDGNKKRMAARNTFTACGALCAARCNDANAALHDGGTGAERGAALSVPLHRRMQHRHVVKIQKSNGGGSACAARGGSDNGTRASAADVTQRLRSSRNDIMISLTCHAQSLSFVTARCRWRQQPGLHGHTGSSSCCCSSAQHCYA
ncbi:hypothetical protein JKP88DRAFT_263605 [Tribonema minus]|uniref:Uncharacterized protein n=1 Tax=Tribonema minus TaxID=303371 RepID=A0A835YWS0_9STRA|nr:hypothetical protein JKP88DRAFT_263605 [Tribonema minus]